MKAQVLQQLAPNIIQLVERIEGYAGMEIGVEEKPGRASHNVSHQHAVIFCDNLTNIPTQGMVHELLHIERTWMQQIPVLATKSLDDPLADGVIDIDNRLEHLVIVPKEAEYGFDPYEYWNLEAHRWWNGDRCHKMASEHRRLNMLMEWLATKRIVADKAVIERATNVLLFYGLFAEAETFANTIVQELDCKTKITAIVVNTLGIPKDRVHFVTIRVREREFFTEPV
jgi:hypothetical protein